MIRSARTDDVFDETADLSRYLYHGSSRDLASGLQFNQLRHYDPNVGRFLSRDPLGFADRNLIRYVGNGPLNPTDPTGL